MSSTKTDTNLNLGGVDGYSLPTAGQQMVSVTGTITTTYGSLLLISITNGGTQTTTAATATVNLSNNGTTWYAMGGSLSAALSGVSTWVIPIPIPAEYVQVVYTPANSYAVTINTHLLSVTKI